mmetsp:Transcript_34962/g.89442  ORF Transcript_34962/g.89442 Transcript_34962/m.89442 type:complete len:199 (+) Transcript_34962:70-666(+)|eukprot:jgi/Tetstr1/447646/TSEL_035005.t1
MAANQYNLHRAAMIKAVLHAAKHPHTAVNGVLLGSCQGSAAGGTQFELEDAVPLFHSHHALAPTLEVALSQIEELTKAGGKLAIVGYYHANERFEDAELGVVAKRISDTISNNCPGACTLLIDSTEVQNYLQQDGTKICELFTRDRGWNKQDGLKYLDAGVADILADYLRDGRQATLADFEDHLEDVTKDWMNPTLLA